MTDAPPPSPANTTVVLEGTQALGTDKVPEAGPTAPTTGRIVFRGLLRELNPDDLMNPGVQKLLVEMVDRADAECARLKDFEEQFHKADKRAAVLEAAAKTSTAVEVLFGVGVGFGGAVMALAPSFWNQQPLGYLCLIIGAGLAGGASYARWVKG
jgi:hypothetical protein